MMILHEERGSLPMALLVIIVMAGLLTVLTASVVAGQRQTRFDESFEESLPMAESGLERAKAVILEGKKSTNFCIEPTSAAPGGELKTTCANPPAKNKWVVSADQTSSGWLLTAIGDVNDTVRTVKQEVKIDSPFQVAAFGKFFADFNGGNGADSYRSGNWDLSSGTPSFTWTDATAVTGL